MMAASRSAKRKCSIESMSMSQAAYSSAVRLVLVAARHWARIASPSQTAKTILVFPASIASSMLGTKEHVARGDARQRPRRIAQQERTVLLQILEHALP